MTPEQVAIVIVILAVLMIFGCAILIGYFLASGALSQTPKIDPLSNEEEGDL